MEESDDEDDDEDGEDTDDDYDEYDGVYELFMVGNCSDGVTVNFGPTFNGMKGLTPIWVRTSPGDKENFFIIYNQKWKQFQLQQWLDSDLSMSEDLLYCKTGFIYLAFPTICKKFR